MKLTKRIASVKRESLTSRSGFEFPVRAVPDRVPRVTSEAWFMEVRDENFVREVLERSRDQLILLDYWAPWCRPCEVVGPVLERLAEEFAGRFLLATVDIDQNPRSAATYAVRSIPLVLAIRNEEVLAQVVGAQPESVYRQLVENLLGSDGGASV